MDEFDSEYEQDDYYQGAAEELIGVEDAVFADIDEAEEDAFDVDWAVDVLYTVVYGGK